MENLLWFLLIGMVVGWFAGIIMKGRGFGLIGNIAVGAVGALLGGWLAGVIGLYTSSLIGTFLVALAGAVLLVGLIGMVQRA